MRVLAALLGFLYLAAPAHAAETLRFKYNGQTPTTLGNQQFFSSGPYSAFMNPYNKGSYVAGTDFTQSLTLFPTPYPGATTIAWNWGSVASTSVYGNVAIDYGDYLNTPAQAPITPQQTKSITTLTQTHNFTIGGTVAGFDVFTDLFLTNLPGSSNTLLFEVEIFEHSPTFVQNFFGTATPIGSTTISGVAWSVAKIVSGAAQLDILFMPTNHADVPSGSIDIKAMFSYLVAQGIITGNEYYNGMIALGSEPVQFDGVLTINSLSEVYN